jgi:hypothetical protein
MHSESNAQITTQPAGSLELVNYGAGFAWLKPAIAAADRIERRAHRLLDRYALTQRGLDVLARERAMANLFGPWPTVVESVLS